MQLFHDKNGRRAVFSFQRLTFSSELPLILAASGSVFLHAGSFSKRRLNFDSRIIA